MFEIMITPYTIIWRKLKTKNYVEKQIELLKCILLLKDFQFVIICDIEVCLRFCIQFNNGSTYNYLYKTVLTVWMYNKTHQVIKNDN